MEQNTNPEYTITTEQILVNQNVGQLLIKYRPIVLHYYTVYNSMICPSNKK